MLTVSDYVKTLKKGNDSWGVSGYYVPVNDNYYKTMYTQKWNNVKDTHSFI